mmetsp:Transcript_14184/g.60708  ORF Transcript_14184/g.60708 Transcript_14184/m.60708 type:complete len:277 (-) Transcript_14184:41-871(-)
MLPFLLPSFLVMNPVFFFPPTFAWKLCQSFRFAVCSASFSNMRCLPLNALACFRLRSRVASSSPSTTLNFSGTARFEKALFSVTRRRFGAGTPWYTSRGRAESSPPRSPAASPRTMSKSSSESSAFPSAAPAASRTSSGATSATTSSSPLVTTTRMRPSASTATITASSHSDVAPSARTRHNAPATLSSMMDASASFPSASAPASFAFASGWPSTRSSVMAITSTKPALSSTYSAFSGSATRSCSTCSSCSLYSARFAVISARVCGASSSAMATAR